MILFEMTLGEYKVRYADLSPSVCLFVRLFVRLSLPDSVLLTDRTSGRAYGAICRLSVCRL